MPAPPPPPPPPPYPDPTQPSCPSCPSPPSPPPSAWPLLPQPLTSTWISRAHPLNELEDCAIAVDATYYLQLHLDVLPGNEPLLPALGGLTGIQGRIENELDQWKAHRITPLFIFDGQSMAGQDETLVKRGLENCVKTDVSWDLYFNGRADEAVSASGRAPVRLGKTLDLPCVAVPPG